ncbi:MULTISPECIES: gluconate 2-dehydrogenase subunit 3 family protein [unclassified Lysobacter]|uniref:gluconate 2-dehydrogenase subunit 3 family protein n=1 Tax=unclassified Lysobacter TaxID=2635362 RepID=UPI001BEB36BC|nr:MULTISPECIES: gluconate 2-dehydrogenase subunit 3 family protein [unclassified Lysobacter]MBT2744911.1 gluconate 2-dehydrogenase subunit 3 family protein [Lysobacter sp. ISL-42]MBT2752096.1 gluconate 2-dehydrogenase subunit 3 family protein [Lysobacter sp. ISL-50]MBT2778593.1 gluconate 2-dehydrogenase subunit 3 family protein [Lysobacter sp. ISL-54]MBT2780476.1 gluconate 2-dehydrogenase subunit 3 family protein [Lysobacter sp. ISL-52]
MDRRTSLKWMLSAASALPLLQLAGCSSDLPPPRLPSGVGYGTDPDLLKTYGPGSVWPLTLDERQRRIATALCSLIVPDEPDAPGAVAVGVVDFINEWVSAPYPRQVKDRKLILAGFDWLDEQAEQRFSRSFGESVESQRTAICDDICYLPRARAEFKQAARFFARYRDLTIGGFCTSPQGRNYLGYVGNVPMASFEGPPPEVLKLVGVG